MRHKLALILWKCFSLNILSSFNRLQAASWQHNEATLKKQFFFIVYCSLPSSRKGEEEEDSVMMPLLIKPYCAHSKGLGGGEEGAFSSVKCVRVFDKQRPLVLKADEMCSIQYFSSFPLNYIHV